VPFDPAKYKRWLRDRPERRSEVFDLPPSTDITVHAPRDLQTQVVPLVPGGNSGLARHLATHMRYPEEARRRDIEGTVVVAFTVEASGAVTNMHAVEELGGGCTMEAMRLVERTPWAPGVKDGQRVRSQSRVSIRFALPK
jgi:protein TonB